MKQGGWPRPPLILALVLGTMIENNYQLTMQIYDGLGWMYQRPIVVCIEIAIAISIFVAVKGFARSASPRVKEIDESSDTRPLMSVAIAMFLLLVFGWAYQAAQAFEDPEAARFPVTILFAAIPLVMIVLIQDLRLAYKSVHTSGDAGAVWASACQRWRLRESAVFFAYLLAILLSTYLVGQLVALPVFATVYARRWGGFSWRGSMSYGAGSLLAVWGIYVKLMNLPLYPSLLFG
jgi:hypothetical protein